MKRGELAKKKRKGCLTALLVVWAVFIVKVIAVLNPGFPEAWRMVEAGQIAGFAYIWLLVFLVLLCCFVLWRIVPKGYFRKKKPETSRPAGEWAVSIPTHENPVVVGNPFRGIFIAGAAGSGKSESVAVPLLLEFIRKGFAGIVYDFKFPALDNDISSFLNATGSDLRHFRLNFSNPYRTDFVNPIQPEYVPNTSYAREYAVSIVANLTKESIKNPDFWSRSATDVLTACIWYLREEHPEICDIPHVLAMVGSNGTALLNTLQKNIITEQMVRSVYDALQRGADNQVSGVLGTLQGAVAQINTPEMMWVFSRPGCPLDVNNPDHPAILTVATNPTTSQTLSPLCSLVITVATTLMNRKYSINSLVYWVTYVHNVVYSFYRSMIYCYINSTQRCAGSIVIDIIPTNGADKRKFFPFAPYFPVTNVIKRYFYPYFPAIIGIKGYSFPYFPYLSGIMKIKTALYSLFSRLDWHKTVVFPCLGEIYEGIRSLSWEIPVT